MNKAKSQQPAKKKELSEINEETAQPGRSKTRQLEKATRKEKEKRSNTKEREKESEHGEVNEN